MKEPTIAEMKEYIADLEAGSSAAHKVLDRYGAPRETVVWKGPIQNVTEHSVHERIELFMKAMNIQSSSYPTEDPTQLHTES
jgi:hypothetical protein